MKPTQETWGKRFKGLPDKKWRKRRKAERRAVYESLASFGEPKAYEHPDLLFNTEVTFWRGIRIIIDESGHATGLP